MLKPYQLSSLNFLIKNYAESRNTILADEMGLGKTIQTIAFLNFIKTHYQKCGIHLVVAPLSTLGHWKKVFEDWTNLNSIVYYDSEGLEGRTRCRALEFFHTDISMSGKVMNNASISKLDAIVTSYEVFLQDIAIF
jgi:SNF2 family DNA or RNA helicase